MSYNHGILLSSAALLHRVTGEAAYLDAASRLLAAAAANLTDVEGSLRDVQRGSRDQGVPCAARLGPIPNPAPIPARPRLHAASRSRTSASDGPSVLRCPAPATPRAGAMRATGTTRAPTSSLSTASSPRTPRTRPRTSPPRTVRRAAPPIGACATHDAPGARVVAQASRRRCGRRCSSSWAPPPITHGFAPRCGHPSPPMTSATWAMAAATWAAVTAAAEGRRRARGATRVLPSFGGGSRRPKVRLRRRPTQGGG